MGIRWILRTLCHSSLTVPVKSQRQPARSAADAATAHMHATSSAQAPHDPSAAVIHRFGCLPPEWHDWQRRQRRCRRRSDPPPRSQVHSSTLGGLPLVHACQWSPAAARAPAQVTSAHGHRPAGRRRRTVSALGWMADATAARVAWDVCVEQVCSESHGSSASTIDPTIYAGALFNPS
jgi:hypothetical protein